MSDSAAWPRLLASLGAVVLGAVAVVVVAVLGHRTPGPVDSSAAASSQPAASSSQGGEAAFPAPPKKAVVFSRPVGSDVLALAVTPGSPLGLQASVVDVQGEGVDGLRVNFRVGDRAAVGEPCGSGCYSATAAVAGAPKEVVVSVERKDGTKTTWHVPMPAQWPPRNASALVARATKTYRALDTLTIHDSLTSDVSRSPVVTRWRIVAPDKLAYRIEGGTEGMIIGNTRWDRTPGSAWVKAGQAPIHQPTPFWQTWRNAHVLATTKDGWRVSFFDPTTPGWYELFVQRKTMRPLEMYMRAKAHFMHDEYSDFNKPITITPPQ